MGNTYSPDWMKKSRDDVPASNKPPPSNKVFDALVATQAEISKTEISMKVKIEQCLCEKS